jgi:hypothetical protein
LLRSPILIKKSSALLFTITSGDVNVAIFLFFPN